MFNPFAMMIQAQLSLAEGWARLFTESMQTCTSLYQQNLGLMTTSAHNRQHDVAPVGADWADHYGRRDHDVDVEHMR